MKNRLRKKRDSQVLLLIIPGVVILILCLAFCIERCIRVHIGDIVVESNLNATWIGSVASYWGGIIGGVISGMLAVLGVFLTISYYKESDIKKEIASLQPFIRTTPEVRSEVERKRGYSYEICDPRSQQAYPVLIKNIGNGFALITKITTKANEDGYDFNIVVDKGDMYAFNIMAQSQRKAKGMTFSLMFIDAMRNEYKQTFEYKEKNGKTEIEIGYPQLLKTN